jgi:hypothetical protein
MAAVREEGLYGYINKDRKYVIAPQYEFATAFDHGVAKVNKDGRNYYIDTKGHEVLSGEYTSLTMVSADRGIVETETAKMGLVNIQTGKLIIDTMYKIIRPTPAANYVVTLAALNTYSDALMDGNGKALVPFGKYHTIHSFSEGYAVAYMYDNVAKVDIYSVIDEKGKVMFQLPPKKGFEMPGDEGYHNGYIKVYLNNGGRNYYGFVNLKGELVMSDSAYKRGITEFSDGRAILYRSEVDYVVIDTNLQKVSLPSFKTISSFNNGNAVATTLADREVVIDRDGKIIMQPKYADLRRIRNSDYFSFAKSDPKVGNFFGIVDLKGKEIVTDLKDFYEGDGFVGGVMSFILTGDRIVYVDTTGYVFWRMPKEDTSKLLPLNVDYRSYAHCYVWEEKPDDEYARYGSGSYPLKIEGNSFPANKLAVTIDTARKGAFGPYQGYEMFVSNTTGDTVKFEVEDRRLSLVMQAKTSKADWSDIEFEMHSWCGNSYFTMGLGKDMYWRFVMPQYHGAVPAKIRAVLRYKGGEVVSNEISGSINPAQLWNSLEYRSTNLMDPYGR